MSLTFLSAAAPSTRPHGSGAGRLGTRRRGFRPVGVQDRHAESRVPSEPGPDWNGLGAASGGRAAAQVGHTPQAQTFRDFAEPLAAGREETAQECALAQLL